MVKKHRQAASQIALLVRRSLCVTRVAGSNPTWIFLLFLIFEYYFIILYCSKMLKFPRYNSKFVSWFSWFYVQVKTREHPICNRNKFMVATRVRVISRTKNHEQFRVVSRCHSYTSWYSSRFLAAFGTVYCALCNMYCRYRYYI